MGWSTVQTRIFPLHYQYIAFILSFVFPPEASLCITRNMKKFDEDENKKEHLLMYEYGHIIHNLVKVPSEAIHYCRSSIKEIYRYSPHFTTSNTMFMRNVVVRKIKSLGEKARRHSTTTNFIYWMGDFFNNSSDLLQTKSISKKMIDFIKRENINIKRIKGFYNEYSICDIIISNRNYEIKNNNENYVVKHNDEEIKSACYGNKSIKKMEIKDYVMKNEKPRKYMKQSMKISKNIKHYNNKPMRYKMSRNRRCC